MPLNCVQNALNITDKAKLEWIANIHEINNPCRFDCLKNYTSELAIYLIK